MLFYSFSQYLNPPVFRLGFPFSDEDVRKIRVFGSTMPMLLTRRDEDDITRGHDFSSLSVATTPLP